MFHGCPIVDGVAANQLGKIFRIGDLLEVVNGCPSLVHFIASPLCAESLIRHGQSCRAWLAADRVKV
jgi:hypothetical protein